MISNLNEARRLAGLAEKPEPIVEAPMKDKPDVANPKLDKLCKKYAGKEMTEAALKDVYSSGYADGYNDSPKK